MRQQWSKAPGEARVIRNDARFLSVEDTKRFVWVMLIGAALLIVAAGSLSGCSSGGSSSNGGGTTTPSQYLTFAGSSNGETVLDANGTAYRFSATNGCMYLVSNGVGPSGFCLTPSSASSTGYAAYGPTNCSTPTTNSLCNVANFAVQLAPSPTSSTTCLAVLTNGSSNTQYWNPLTVTGGSTGFTINQATTATAFPIYWNDVVPICGGSNPYAGSYLGTATGDESYALVGTPGSCASISAPNSTSSLSFNIDSGGLIDNNTSSGSISGSPGPFYFAIFGSISATGAGSFSQPGPYGTSYATNCQPKYTITSATKNTAGKWVLAGTWVFGTSNASDTFTMTEQ